jgi:hypothetical protein
MHILLLLICNKSLALNKSGTFAVLIRSTIIGVLGKYALIVSRVFMGSISY